MQTVSVIKCQLQNGQEELADEMSTGPHFDKDS